MAVKHTKAASKKPKLTAATSIAPRATAATETAPLATLDPDLTIKEQKFADLYVLYLNGAKAAREAGYTNNQRQIASENLRKPHIQARIQAHLAHAAMSAQEVLYRLTEQARGSLDPFFTFLPDGKVEFNLQAAQQANALHLAQEISIRPTEHGTEITVKAYSAQTALLTLARYHKLLTDRIVVYDWRKEVADLGLDPDSALDALAKDIEAALASSEG